MSDPTSLTPQQQLDADAAAITAAVTALQSEIASLQAQQTSPPLDFSGLTSALASLTALAPVPAASPSASTPSSGSTS
jgi:hypothetical protein